MSTPPIYQWKKDCEIRIEEIKEELRQLESYPKTPELANKSKTWKANLFLNTSLWKITKDVFNFMKANFMNIKEKKS